MRSLRRHFAVWLGAGTAAGLLVAGALHFHHHYLPSAAAQDARLAARLGAADPGGMWQRSAVGGERLEGSATLPPYPWARDLQAGNAADLYYTHAAGQLLRAAVRMRAHGEGPPEVLQVAEPARLRLPAPGVLQSGSWPAFAAGMVLMAVLAASAAARARKHLLRALRAFDGAAGGPLSPAELAPTLQRLRDLQHEQLRWVEEQRRFLADAAHQLRTPMAVLRTQLQAALAAPEEAGHLLGGMLHTVDRATGLANQLLSLTRIEQLKRAGRLGSVDVAAAVSDAVVELSPLIARKRLDFVLEGDGFTAPADAVMLGQLLRNLLANAIHHGPRGSRLGVVLRGQPPWRELVVWDEGPGIADDVKPRLFTPFAAGQGGMGLGLSICQQIAEAMRAEVRLHDRLDGERVVGVDAVLVWHPPA